MVELEPSREQPRGPMRHLSRVGGGVSVAATIRRSSNAFGGPGRTTTSASPASPV